MAEEINKEMVEHEIVTKDSKENLNSNGVHEENQQGKQMEGKNKDDMKPWEQHAAVISIPRFDYKAPPSLIQHSHSGFLITCPISQLPLPFISQSIFL